MKTTINFLVMLVLLSATVLAAGQGMNQQHATTDEQLEGGVAEDLSDNEIAGLLLMREEEKLAHDVYITLFERWEKPIFSNIASSEQTHTEAVAAVLEVYGLEDPVTSDAEVGQFSNEDLAALYTDLVAQGETSLLDALIVGATVEDLDIYDLEQLMQETDNQDLLLVYENLQKGSRNHMRSFIRQIELEGGSYEAQYISEDELQSIIGGEQENGQILTPGSDVDSALLQQHMRRGQVVTGGQGNGGPQESAPGQGVQQNQQAQNANAGSQGQAQVATAAQNQLQYKGKGLQSSLSISQDGTTNQYRAQLSNGVQAQIKYMPEAVAQQAMERLGLNVCSEENNCQIQLREVGQGEQVRAAYQVQAQKEARVLGMFKTQMNVQTQIDAETGETISTNRPWWAFLASS